MNYQWTGLLICPEISYADQKSHALLFHQGKRSEKPFHDFEQTARQHKILSLVLMGFYIGNRSGNLFQDFEEAAGPQTTSGLEMTILEECQQSTHLHMF